MNEGRKKWPCVVNWVAKCMDFVLNSVSVLGPQRRTLVPNRANYNTLC